MRAPSSDRRIILSAISQALLVPISNIDTTKSFTELGGHSLAAVEVLTQCKNASRPPTILSLLASPSIDDVLSSNLGLEGEIGKKESTDLVVVDPRSCGDSEFDVLPHQSAPPFVSSYASDYSSVASEEPEQCAAVPDVTPVGELRRSSLITTAPCTTPGADATARAAVTEIQLAFIQGSENARTRNTIRYFESYRLEDIPIMKQAWKTVISMEPIFRIVFLNDEEGVYQAQLDSVSLTWEEVVTYDRESYESEIARQRHAKQPGYSFRTVMFKSPYVGQSEGTIIISIHHALIDGYSMMLLTKKVRTVAAGRTVTPGKSFLTAVEEVEQLRQGLHSSGTELWDRKAEEYAASTGVLNIPKHNSSGEKREANDVVTISFADLSSKIPETAKLLGVTPATLFYVAWALVHAFYSDCESVVFGAVLSGRSLPIDGIETVIGPLLNTLPLHVSIDGNETAGSFARRVFRDLVELLSLQWTTPEHGYSRDFESALSVGYSMQSSESDAIQPIHRCHYEVESDIPLSITIEESSSLNLAYHGDVYSRQAIQDLADCFRTALESVLCPNWTVKTCLDSLLTVPMQQRLRKFGNCTSGLTTAIAHQEDLVCLFEEVVARYPEAVAIEAMDQAISYSMLNSLADRVSATLAGVVTEQEVVCVHADGSLHWIVALLGALKSGAVICSLDSTLPPDLRNSMFRAANSKVFVVGKESEAYIQPEDCKFCFAVDSLTDGSTPAPTPSNSSRRCPTPSAPAYLCFTSGSTGKPKGVMCTHQGLVAFQKDLEVRLMARPGVKISQFMSPAFDGSIHEIFSALCYGATLVLRTGGDPFGVLTRVDSAIFTPSVARSLPSRKFPNLKTVYLVGEPVPQAVVEDWGAGRKLYNMYGPTEGTCGATITRLVPGRPVTIGQPNPTTRVYILNRQGRLMPPGAVGEIHLAGVQIARGYLQMQRETEERFLPDMICSGLGERMYKTGDRGYWGEDGQVVCLGRNDRQIKLRGFRLDLDDLETRIMQAAPDLKAVVLTRAEKGDHLIAMVQPSTLDVTSLKLAIKAKLPRQAIPSIIACVDKFPVTRAGKVDHKAISRTLPIGESNLVESKLHTDTEAKLAAIWRKLLRLDPEVAVTRDSNFSELGGHSILLVHLRSALMKDHGWNLPMCILSKAASLGCIAQEIDLLEEKEPVYRSSGAGVARYSELTPIELEWWQKYELGEETSAFNVSYVCSLSHEVDVERLTDSWNTILARHQILRSRFFKECSTGRAKRTFQQSPPTVFRADRIDIRTEINSPFHLDQEHPIRVTISPETSVVVISHIICDFTALQLLLREVADVYMDRPLPVPEQTYMESSIWDRNPTTGELAFWEKNLNGTTKWSRSARKDYHGTSQTWIVDTSLFHKMCSFAGEHRITLNQLVIGAVAAMLQHDQMSTDVVVGVPYINRATEQDMQTMGLFLEPLPIRVKFEPPEEPTDDSSSHYLKAVQKSSQDSLAHAVPWHSLLGHLSVEHDYPNHPLFDVVVSFHDIRPRSHTDFMDSGIAGADPLFVWTEGSKFQLMCEFTALTDDTLTLRLEYDLDCFPGESIDSVQGMVVQALQSLTEGESHHKLKETLQDLSEQGSTKSSSDLFGRVLGEISSE